MAEDKSRNFRVYFVDGNHIDVKASGFKKRGSTEYISGWTTEQSDARKLMDGVSFKTSEVRAIVAHDQLSSDPGGDESRTFFSKASG